MKKEKKENLGSEKLAENQMPVTTGSQAGCLQGTC